MPRKWRNDPATERQKGALRLYGYAFDDGISKGQARDAIDECDRKFPLRELKHGGGFATQAQLETIQRLLKCEEPVRRDDGRPLTYKNAFQLIRGIEFYEKSPDEVKGTMKWPRDVAGLRKYVDRGNGEQPKRKENSYSLGVMIFLIFVLWILWKMFSK